MQLTQSQEALHSLALELCHKRLKLDARLIEVLIAIDQEKIFKRLGHSSLFKYAVDALGLAESVAYQFILVARKTKEVQPLRQAIQDGQISVAKASRMASVIDKENVKELLAFAKTHSTRELDFEVARLSPKRARKESARPLSFDRVELRLSLSKEVYEKLKRAQGLALKSGELTLERTLEALVEDYLKRHDPLKKALRRSATKKTVESHRAPLGVGAKAPKLCAHKVRKTLSAQERHTVILRDQGRCTHRDAQGKRCTNQRWIEVHHIKRVSEGGGNDPSNLLTLCSFHHDLVHQLSLGIDGQMNWIKSPVMPYRAPLTPTHSNDKRLHPIVRPDRMPSNWEPYLKVVRGWS